MNAVSEIFRDVRATTELLAPHDLLPESVHEDTFKALVLSSFRHKGNEKWKIESEFKIGNRRVDLLIDTGATAVLVELKVIPITMASVYEFDRNDTHVDKARKANDLAQAWAEEPDLVVDERFYRPFDKAEKTLYQVMKDAARQVNAYKEALLPHPARKRAWKKVDSVVACQVGREVFSLLPETWAMAEQSSLPTDRAGMVWNKCVFRTTSPPDPRSGSL